MGSLSFLHDEAGGLTVTAPDGTPVATVAPNEWETRFFGRRIGRLVITPDAAAGLTPEHWREAVALVATEADAYRLVQAHLDVRHLALAPALEEAGFRLVDTRIGFLTRLDRRRLDRHAPPAGRVRFATPEDLPDLLELTRRRLTDNPAFRSRYKDPAYFSHKEAASWFAAWVENHLTDPSSRVAVWVVDERAVGFFGYQLRGEREGLPFYKSTIAAVEEDRRGQKAHIFLQTAIFDGMPTDEFWVEGITQLANTPVIHNNFLLGRRLDRIEFTFFRIPG